MRDFSGLAIDNYKGLPDRPHRESCSPHTGFGARPALQFVKVAAVKGSHPLAHHALCNICISSPSTLIPTSLYLRPWAEVFFRSSIETSL